MDTKAHTGDSVIGKGLLGGIGNVQIYSSWVVRDGDESKTIIASGLMTPTSIPPNQATVQKTVFL